MADATGVPREFAGAPLRTVRPKDLSATYANPRRQLERLVTRGRALRLATGYFCAIPDDRGATWRPAIEAAAAGIATAIFAPPLPILMGLSAARLHGATPRALAAAFVAAPRQHRPIHLDYTHATVVFLARQVTSLDAELIQTDLGGVLVTTPEQTVLDLARRPDLGDLEQESTDAIRALWPRCDKDTLESIAIGQRLRAAWRRASETARA